MYRDYIMGRQSVADQTALEKILKRDRMIVVAGLGGVIVLAWFYIVLHDGGMTAAAMSGLTPWTGSHFVLMFLMWAVMMVGMMLPSAAPMILLYMLVARKSAEKNTPIVATGVFVAGYAAAWAGFSLGATLLQWGFEKFALLSPMMASANPEFGGGLLIAAGVYQWTPLKDRCLGNCRAPLSFLTTSWRDGRAGAFRMGLEQGFYCVGCCWVLMGLLFIGGVMNLLWIAAISLFVLAEKVLPVRDARTASRLSGVVMVLIALLLLYRWTAAGS
jgi:predicted metal-binding membrane protein